MAKNRITTHLAAPPTEQHPRISGYCRLCRAKEMSIYGTVINDANKRHARACKSAGCDHPASYTWEEARAIIAELEGVSPDDVVFPTCACCGEEGHKSVIDHFA